jgi:hypothetical protein
MKVSIILIAAIVFLVMFAVVKLVSSDKPLAGIAPPIAARTLNVETPPFKPGSHTPSLFVWHESLLAIQSNTNSLFGAGADNAMTELQSFAENIPDADLPYALSELQQLQSELPTSKGRDLEMRLLRRWSHISPSSAARWSMQMPEDIRADAISAVAKTWTASNAQAASDWAISITDSVSKSIAIKSVIGAAQYHDPKEALILAADLPQDATRDEMIQNAAGVWASTSPQEAITWAKDIPDDALRQQVVSVIATTWADTDPITAANLAIDSLSAGQVRDRTVLAIVERWGLTDATGATEWVKSFPDSELRNAALGAIAADVQRSKSPSF